MLRPEEKHSTTPNIFGEHCKLPDFDKERHVPLLGLINPKSGAHVGTDILNICKRTSYYQHRFFNIIEVVKSKGQGGALDIFRIELFAARDEAREIKRSASSCVWRRGWHSFVQPLRDPDCVKGRR